MPNEEIILSGKFEIKGKGTDGDSIKINLILDNGKRIGTNIKPCPLFFENETEYDYKSLFSTAFESLGRFIYSKFLSSKYGDIIK